MVFTVFFYPKQTDLTGNQKVDVLASLFLFSTENIDHSAAWDNYLIGGWCNRQYATCGDEYKNWSNIISTPVFCCNDYFSVKHIIICGHQLIFCDFYIIVSLVSHCVRRLFNSERYSKIWLVNRRGVANAPRISLLRESLLLSPQFSPVKSVWRCFSTEAHAVGLPEYC